MYQILLALSIAVFSTLSFATEANSSLLLEPSVYYVNASMSPESIKTAISEAVAQDAQAHAGDLQSEESRNVVMFVWDNTRKTSYGVVANYFIAKSIYGEGQDKIKHMIAGGFIANGTEILLKETLSDKFSDRQKFWISKVGGVIAASVAGIAKEEYDRQGHGTVDRKDAEATALGGLVSTFTFELP